jgi:hypothetical protein
LIITLLSCSDRVMFVTLAMCTGMQEMLQLLYQQQQALQHDVRRALSATRRQLVRVAHCLPASSHSTSYRKTAQSAYDKDPPAGHLRCLITGQYFKEEMVVGAHIFPLSWPHHELVRNELGSHPCICSIFHVHVRYYNNCCSLWC